MPEPANMFSGPGTSEGRRREEEEEEEKEEEEEVVAGGASESDGTSFMA